MSLLGLSAFFDALPGTGGYETPAPPPGTRVLPRRLHTSLWLLGEVDPLPGAEDRFAESTPGKWVTHKPKTKETK